MFEVRRIRLRKRIIPVAFERDRQRSEREKLETSELHSRCKSVLNETDPVIERR